MTVASMLPCRCFKLCHHSTGLDTNRPPPSLQTRVGGAVSFLLRQDTTSSPTLAANVSWWGCFFFIMATTGPPRCKCELVGPILYYGGIQQWWLIYGFTKYSWNSSRMRIWRIWMVISKLIYQQSCICEI